MFSKTNSTIPTLPKKEGTPSVLTRDLHVLGNIISDGVVDFDGTIEGNIRATTLTIRANSSVKGEVSASTVLVYGHVNGIIRAKHVQLFASCRVEGVIMHETISIEDGAFIDGKFKRTDKIPDSSVEEENFDEAEESDGGSVKMLENIRLIR